MDESTFSLKNGTMVSGDRYTIESLIGAGGFGITYKAVDNSSNKVCAIKEYVPLGLCSRLPDGKLIAMGGDKTEYYEHGKQCFMEEAQCLMTLRDIPNIVRVMDCFEERGTAYYVMEYLKGCDIKHLMRRMPGGKFCVEDAVNIIEIAATSLQQIHATKMMLHRDISPDNIFFCDDGAVYLIDFGSAKHICQQQDQNFSVVLKPGFAPIEQYSRKGAQGTYTDVYALAGTLYYMLTGVMVPSATDRVNGKGYEPAYQVCPDIPRSLSDTIDKALELDYKQRLQTAYEFAQGITQYRRENAVDAVVTETAAAHEEKTKTISIYDRKKVEDIQGVSNDIVARRKPKPYVEIANSEFSGKRWIIPLQTELIVGRSSAVSNIVVPSFAAVSKEHCHIMFDEKEDCFFVYDTSNNGTTTEQIVCPKEQWIPIRNQHFIILAAVCCLKIGVDYE